MKLIRLLSAIVMAGTLAFTTARAIVIHEDFSAAGPGGSPYVRGWTAVGDTNLFVWNSAAGHLEVTWDSSKPNSFFYQPLGMTLNKTHDFSVSFDLMLSSIGSLPGKDGAMQVAVGFINLAQATAPGYYRATGMDSPNLVEFNYFHDTGFGATISPVAISTNHQYALNFSTFLFELQLSQLYRVEMRYVANDQTLYTVLKQNGTNVFEVDVLLTSWDPTFSDFALDTVAISSYSDEGQDPDWAGSVLAHGIVDNFIVETPAPLLGKLLFSKSASAVCVEVYCQPGEAYHLQRTTDFAAWETVATAVAVSPRLVLEDTAPPNEVGFYRVELVQGASCAMTEKEQAEGDAK